MIRVLAASLLTLVVVGCSVEILHDVDETTANEVIAVLDRHGVEGHKTREVQGSKATYTVSVPRAESTRAWRVLRQENLPRPERQGLGEVFGKTSLVPTPTQERALMHHALSGELSRTLESVEGVLEARVHLVIPIRDPLAAPDAPQAQPQASVLLRVGQRSPLTVQQVRELAAGSVKGLAPQAVSVIIVPDQQRQAGSTETDPLVSVGPFRVAAGSRAGLLVTLAACLILLAVLGGATLLLLRRNRSLAAAALARPAAPEARGSLGASRIDGSMLLIERSLSARPRPRATAEGKDSSG